jgi:hypothetical protein
VTVSASITAQSFILGAIEADPAQVRGEGGPISPTLVLLFTVALNPQPPERRLAVTELWGRVQLDGPDQTRLGELARALSPGDPPGLWSSNPASESRHAAELRVPLTAVQLRALEDAPAQDGNLVLRIELRTTAAWARAEHSDLLGPGGGAGVELLPVPWVRTEELRFAVPLGHWAGRVLPGLGADRYRTLLLNLPAENPVAPDEPLVRWFDDARRRYDFGDYRGCIERCRDVRRAVETALQATKSEPVSAKAAATGLPAGTSAFVDGVWRALAEVTNEAHHPEHGEPTYDATDARAVLLTTAVMLEYLGALLGAPALY